MCFDRECAVAAFRGLLSSSGTGRSTERRVVPLPPSSPQQQQEQHKDTEMTAVSPLREKSNFIDDLENWMTNLPESIRQVPLIRIAIPGSHDSMTFSITSKSRISPDAEPPLRRLPFLDPLLEIIMAKWSRTQQYNVLQQLRNGIRYFDLRVATKPGTTELFFVHGQYADNVKVPLGELLAFLDDHPEEVVFLDCQHFYAFTPADHERYMNLLTTMFKRKLVPYSISDMDHLTLNYLTRQFKYQVIIIYRSDAARFGQPLLWPSANWPNPWPNTVSIPKLFSILDNSLCHRDFKRGFISQCVLTPTTFFVIKNVFSNLKSQCAIPLEKKKLKWIDNQKPGEGGLNIIIADFVELSACDFSKTVIQLNEKHLL